MFPIHFQLAQKYGLPMYLHNRNTGDDFFRLVRQHRHMFSTGVVHSFTGTAQEVQQIIELDLYIGINGCSLKTAENLEVVRTIPLDRLMIETDCPYCGISTTHAGYKFIETKYPSVRKEKYKASEEMILIKGRNEPCLIVQVAEVLAGVLGIDKKTIAQTCYQNTLKMLSKCR